jgi:hypothetical protein
MQLHDGTTIWKAMEYENVKCLREPAVGMLLELRPPIEIKNGFLLLKNDSILVLWANGVDLPL